MTVSSEPEKITVLREDEYWQKALGKSFFVDVDMVISENAEQTSCYIQFKSQKGIKEKLVKFLTKNKIDFIGCFVLLVHTPYKDLEAILEQNFELEFSY